MTRSWTRVLFACAFLLATAAPALAQAGVLEGMAGVTDTNDKNMFYAGAIGGRVGWIEITGEFGRMNNILPKKVHDALVVIDPTVDARVRANYGLVNLRFVPDAGVVRPFIGGSVGAAQLRPTITPASLGGIAATLYPTDNRTKFVLAANAGLEFGIAKAAVIDLGYRYFRIYSDYHLNTTSSDDRVLTNVNCFYGLVGVRF